MFPDPPLPPGVRAQRRPVGSVLFPASGPAFGFPLTKTEQDPPYPRPFPPPAHLTPVIGGRGE